MNQPIEKYEPLREISKNLYCVDSDWQQTAFRRRMTVVRLSDNSLVIHSAVQMNSGDLDALDKLGTVTTIVVPNIFHDSEALFYAARYPKAKVFVPKKILYKCSESMTVAGILEKDWPHQSELPIVNFAKNFAAESAFIHLESRTLILTDMAMNLSSADFKNSIEKTVFGKWNGILDFFGPSRITKYVVARDRESLKQAFAAINAFDFDRVIVSHGSIVETNGKQRLIDGYAERFGAF